MNSSSCLCHGSSRQIATLGGSYAATATAEDTNEAHVNDFSCRSLCRLNDGNQYPMLRLRILDKVILIEGSELPGRTLTTKFLERNHRVIVLVIFIHEYLLAVALANYQTSVSPSELVHTPEGVDRQEQAVDRVAVRRMRTCCHTI